MSCSGTAYFAICCQMFAKCSPNVRQMSPNVCQMFSKIYLHLFQKHIKCKKLFWSRKGSPWEMGGCTARHFVGNFGAVLFRGVPGPPKKICFSTYFHTMLAGRALWLAGRLLRLAGRARVRARAQRSGLVEAAFPKVAPKSYWFI